MQLRALSLIGSLCLAAAWAGGCRSAPVTGRQQMLLLPESQELAMGLSAYEDVAAKEPPSTNVRYVEMVERVGRRIAAVANKPDYQWEFRVIAGETQNAFCLPGGKVAVYEGILPICENEAGLAVVMSHEVAHALARHGGERMSQSLAVDAVKQAVSYVTQSQDEVRRVALLKAYGAASQYGVILPYSRKHESEADHIGVMLMAQAGYDPSEAPRFWQRFGEAQQGEKPIEFVSTHPSDARRASDLQALLPQAMEKYLTSAERHGLGEGLAVASPTPHAAPAESGPPATAAGIAPPTTPGGWWSPELLR